MLIKHMVVPLVLVVLAVAAAPALGQEAPLVEKYLMDGKLTDGAKALEFATKAVAVDPHWTLKDTKAAALAEVGRFDEAVAEQSKAIADCKHDPEEVAKMKERLKLYQDKKPYRDEQ